MTDERSISCSQDSSPTTRVMRRSASCWLSASDPALDDHHGRSSGLRRAQGRAGFASSASSRAAGSSGSHAAAGAADDSERHQSASLRDAQGHHGGQEEGDSQGRVAGGLAASQQIVALTLPTRSKQTEMIAARAAEAAKELVRRLREEARAL